MKRQKKLKILLTGGGTGGHIYPLVAVAKQISKSALERGFNPDIRYFGDPGSFKFYLESNDIRVVHITGSKLRRYASIQNFFDIFRFFWGTLQGLSKIFWFMPHVCFSKGGPGAFSVIIAARFYFIPIVIHESDALPGLTNKLSAKYARIIEVAFKSAEKHFDPKKVHLVGNPIRAEIEQVNSVPLSKAEFGFNPEEPLVLFIGGSQGAEKLNDFVLENLPALTEKFQILHQVGPNNFEEFNNAYKFSYGKNEKLKSRYNFQPYFENNIVRAYEAADVIVSRAGAGLIFEIAAAGKPAILIPLPDSANGHQLANAYEYESAGGGLVIEEENFSPGVVTDAIAKILANKELYQKMCASAKNFYVPDSAKMITQDIFNILRI